MSDDKESGGVQSAEVALHLLRVLAEGGGNMVLSRLAAAAGMPAAKAHRYVVSLMRAGFVEQPGRDGNYGLGAQALRLGARCARPSRRHGIGDRQHFRSARRNGSNRVAGDLE